MKSKFLSVFLAVVFLMPKISRAATYYVDCNAANDNGAGTSEGTAWKTFAKVNTTLTGDQSDTKVLFKKNCAWKEQLTVPGAGTSGHPFTFGAYGEGAKPVIDGSNHTNCIHGNGKNWINADNFTLINANEAGLDTNGGDYWSVTNTTAHDNATYGLRISNGSDTCLFQDCIAYHNNLNGVVGNAYAGMGGYNANNLTIRRCESYAQGGFDGDGIQASSVRGVIIEYCTIHDNPRVSPGTSSDNIQLSNCTGATVRYNHLYGGCNSNIIFTGTNSYGEVYYNAISDGYNGIVNLASAPAGAINIYNNTVYNTTAYGLRIYYTGTNNITARNNIFHSTGSPLYIMSGINPTQIFLSNNRYWYTGSSTNIFGWLSDKNSTFATYVAASGKDTIGSSYSDPLNPDTFTTTGGTASVYKTMADVNKKKLLPEIQFFSGKARPGGKP